MIFGILFAFWRFMEIVTLIPIMGMLAYFVHIYASTNALTPIYILILFIVSVLGVAWSIGTLFTYHRSAANSRFVSFVDICFVGALIAGVYYLRGITHQNCTSVTDGSTYQIGFGILGSGTLHGLHFSANKQCTMLKAAFALGIMNIIFFFITSVLAFMHGGRGETTKDTYSRETHYSRHGQRRSGSHRSHRSSHSGSRRHAYV